MTPTAIIAHATKNNLPVPPELRRKNDIITPASKRKLRKFREMNQTEREFAHRLERMKQDGEIEYWGFEEITLRWADMSYTPDFFVIVRTSLDADDETRTFIEALYIETKGGYRHEDSVIKYKAAKDRFRWARFEMWQKIEGRWQQAA